MRACEVIIALTGNQRRGDGDANARKSRGGSVQSIERAFDLLEAMADEGGVVGLSTLASMTDLPLPTIHRLVRTMVDLGYIRQERSRQYVLGPRLIRLGETSAGVLGVLANPILARVVDALGESANLAMLDGDQIVYVAQAQSRHSMRMFTEVGRRVSPHCTAVGKAVMADMPREQVQELLARTGMPKHTEYTVTDADEFARQLEWTFAHGYAVDEGEQELGVRCVAVRVPDAPTRLGLSVSGPAARMTDQMIERAVPLLTSTAAALSERLSRPTGGRGGSGREG